MGTDDISWSSEDYVRESEYDLYALKNSIDKPSSPNDEGGVKYALEDLNDPLLEISDSDMGLHQIFLEEIYFNRAQAFKKLENLNEAEKDYQKAIDVNPGRNDATFYHYLGCAKFQLKRPIGDILNCFDNSIKYNKNDDAFSLRLSDTYYMRAAARLSDEKFSDAKKDIEKAFELDPKDDAIHRLKNEIEDILKNTSQNNNNKVESVTDIKKTDKFCSKCGEHFNGEEKFCTSCGNKRNIVELDDRWLGSESDLIVESNKEFKSAINNIDVENLDSFSVDIILSKWSTYEEVTYDGDFECYGYELTGGIANKWTKHLGCYTNNLVGFLNDVGDNDLHQLDSNLKYDSTNFEEEPDYTFIEKINWNEGTPKKIKKEIEENYSSNDYEKLISKTNPNESFGDIEFFNKEQSNLFQIIVKYDQGGVEKSIIWSDTEHEEGKCRECKCEVKSHLRFCESCEAKRSKALDNIDKSLAYLEKISPEKEANGSDNKNLESDQENKQKIIEESKAIIDKIKNNELYIRVSQGEDLHCDFQFNEEFKSYAETDEFKEHSAFYGKIEPFDYSYDNDIERYVTNPELYFSLETLSGRLQLWQVFKVSKKDFLEQINYFIESVKEDCEYYGQYESVKDYLEEVEWDTEFGNLPYSEHTLGFNGPKLKECLIGFYKEENKGYELKIEFIDISNEQTKQNLNNIKEKIVSSNKKLRDEINKFNLTEIKSFSVDILFDKWSFFEEINYTGNFKGFDFTLNGGTAIKWSKHKGCYKDDVDAFLNDINSKEISELDFQSLNYECDDSDEDYDYNFFEKIIWNKNTPTEIIKDIEENYSENEYEKLRDEIELEEDYLEIELLQKKGFINQIDINITFENETKNLKWIKKEDDSKEEIPKNAKKINNEKDLIQELGKLDPEEYKKKAFDLWRYFFLKNYDESEEKDGWEIGQEVNSVMFDMYEVDFVSFFHNHKDSGDTETMGIRFPFKYLENGKPALIYNFPFKYDKITTHSSGSFYQLDDVWGSLNEVCKSLSELEVIDFEKLSQNEKIKMFKPKRDDYS